MVFFKPTLFSSFIDGFINAVSLKKQINIIKTSSRTREIMLKAVILNGVFWLGSLFLIEYLFNSSDNHHIHGLSYKILTGYFLYLFCLFINSRLFDQIARSTLHLNYPLQLYNTPNNFTKTISWPSTLYTMSFYSNCALFIIMIRQIPYIGSIIGFFFNSIIFAYYCFEYKWIELGWTQEHMMSFVEHHWSYFFGFGIPVTCLTYFLSTLHAGAVFSLFYPSFIINANIGNTNFNHHLVQTKLPVFFLIRTFNRFILSLIRLINTNLFIKVVKQNELNNKDMLGKIV